jgi:hypothetical protein
MQTSHKRRWLVVVSVIATLVIIALILPREVSSRGEKAEVVVSTTPAVIEPVGPVLSHRQEVWRYVLEWCECRGNHEAINQVDKDGTPSYYAFQFKPSTFRYYGEMYGVIPKGLTQAELMEQLKSYQLQKDIVGYMILDPKVNWYQQFPDCVRKNGLPPKE